MSKVVIVANAGLKNCRQAGVEIDNFDVVVRMNRFVTTGYEEYLGTKTDSWYINRKILLQKTNRYFKFYNKNWDNHKIKYSTLNECVMMTYCHEKDEAESLRKEDMVIDSNIKVADTYNVMCELTDRWKDIYSNDGFKKPGTGILAILYHINLNDEVYIHNFDWGKTHHYWGVKGPEDVPSNHHTWGFEEKVVEDLIKENKIKIL